MSLSVSNKQMMPVSVLNKQTMSVSNKQTMSLSVSNIQSMSLSVFNKQTMSVSTKQPMSVFFTNVSFTKKIYFCERIKLRSVLSVKNIPFAFFAFFFPCMSIFLFCSSPDFYNLYVFVEN
jgi:hypothetical protein